MIKTKNKRAQNLGKRTRTAFNDLSNHFYYSDDEPVLESLTFGVRKDHF